MAQKWIDKIEKNNEEYDIYREGFEIGTNESGNYTLSLSNTPPVYSITDQVPYNFRPSGGDLNIGKKELDELVGGTVAWNQLVQNGNFSNGKSGWGTTYGTLEIVDDVAEYTVSTVGTGTQNRISKSSDQYIDVIEGHKYFINFGIKTPYAQNAFLYAYAIESSQSTISVTTKTTSAGSWIDFGRIVRSVASGVSQLRIGAYSVNDTAVGDKYYFKNVVFFDLTQKFGPTIADHIYSLEVASVGAGVAWLHEYGFYDKSYYPYNPGGLISVKTSAHKMVGFNQFNISSKKNNRVIAWTTGNVTTENMSIVSNYIRIVPRAKYYCNYRAQWCCYDNNYTYLGAIDPSGTLVFSTGIETNSVTLPTDYNIVFIRLGIRTIVNGGEDMTVKTDINLNISDNGSHDGEYKPYQEHTYNLSNVELRGIFKLDSNNKLYCDGDIEKSDGTITRKYGIVDLGTLTWAYNSTYECFYSVQITDAKSHGGTVIPNCVTSKGYTPVGRMYADSPNLVISVNSNFHSINGTYIKDTQYGSDANAFSAAMSGVYLVYELETPTEEKTNFFTNPQTVYNQGTEEYIDNREVAIPVGHNTKYDEPWEEIKN